jgi:hypothetical protein
LPANFLPNAISMSSARPEPIMQSRGLRHGCASWLGSYTVPVLPYKAWLGSSLLPIARCFRGRHRAVKKQDHNAVRD